MHCILLIYVVRQMHFGYCWLCLCLLTNLQMLMSVKMNLISVQTIAEWKLKTMKYSTISVTNFGLSALTFSWGMRKNRDNFFECQSAYFCLELENIIMSWPWYEHLIHSKTGLIAETGHLYFSKKYISIEGKGFKCTVIWNGQIQTTSS